MNKTSGKNKKSLIIIFAALLLVAAATIGILIFSGAFSAPEKQNKGEGVVGIISDDWDPGVEETNGQPKKGTQIPGYSIAEMNAGDKTLKLSIGNPKDNKVGMFATLKLEDDTVLYESPLLKPGQGMTEVPLNESLEKGEYNAKVVYQCVMLDEKNTPLNAAESGFKLIVK